MKKHTIFILSLMTAMTGCGDFSDHDLRDFTANAGKGSKEKIPAIPEPEPYKPAEFRVPAIGSPFQYRQAVAIATLRNSENELNRPDTTRPRGPLEGFELDQLRMIGFMDTKKGPQALVRTNTGLVYRVVKGNYIGKRFGIIKSITATGMELTETVQDSSTGNWEYKNANLPLIENNPDLKSDNKGAASPFKAATK